MSQTTEEIKNYPKGKQALLEEAVLAFWNERDIFKKAETKGLEKFVFYDGPPFATGIPHYGHILAGTIKDAIPRYQTMRGKRVVRRWGWDCHGLPLENQIEKELGLETKRDIEKLGIGKFNEAARDAVLRYAHIWREIVPRLGRWVDMDNDYKTMDSSYTESVWWAFKTLYEKNLIYKGFKAMHLCPRCGTTLSNFEVSQGYKDITDISVTVKLELEDEPGTYLLAWTTTPWTLPGNVAAVVNPEVVYVSLRHEEKQYIVAEAKAPVLFPNSAVSRSFSGVDLIGKSYKPIFPYFQNKEIEGKEKMFKVYGASYVTTESGTGIVHLAPAFGEEDLLLAKHEGLPIIHHVDQNGHFVSEVADFADMPAKPKEDHQSTDVAIIKYLAKSGTLFSKEKIVHSYPHCWRCDSPLLNYAATSWFVKVPEIKEKIVKENKDIRWVPQTVGEYRFGNWLSGAPDWAISRSRFWGAPLPVWEGEKSGERVVVGSLEDLSRYTKKSDNRYLVMRHGKAKSNDLGIVTSDIAYENHLTEEGVRQVEESATSLIEEGIDLIISSPLIRTKETALLVAKKINLSDENVLFDERLREVSFGVFEQKPIPEFHAFFSGFEERFTKSHSGGENLREVKQRLGDFLYSLEKEYQGKKILIVTHGDPVVLLSAIARGASLQETVGLFEKERVYIKNAEVRNISFISLPHNKDYELDFHRPYIDEVELTLPNGEKLIRTPEVFDCWFESGSMPFAEQHYPFNKEGFNPDLGLGYPADFIAEGLDQTRGWFYSLIVLGVALFGRSSYKSVIVNGLVLAEDGQKMSKRLKNYPDPMEMISAHGADALRLYLLLSPVVRGEDLNFSSRGVDEVGKKNLGRLLNVLTFFQTYALDASFSETVLEKIVSETVSSLDRWILARLAQTTDEVTLAMEAYELDRAVRPLALFIDDLSTWYLRRSRDRFKSEDIKDVQVVKAVTLHVLNQFSKLLAPFAPFTAEHIFQNLSISGREESVHLELWPKTSEPDHAIIARMAEVRGVVARALEVRSREGIKVRQPLSKVSFHSLLLEADEPLLGLIADEVNVKEVVVQKGEGGSVELDTLISQALLEEGIVRDLVRAIQEERRSQNLAYTDSVDLVVGVSEFPFLENWKAQFSKQVNAKNVSFLPSVDGVILETDKGRVSFKISKA